MTRASDSVALLDQDMAEKNLSGYWSLGMEGLPSEPMTSVKPCLWKWRDVHQSLVRAGRSSVSKIASGVSFGWSIPVSTAGAVLRHTLCRFPFSM